MSSSDQSFVKGFSLHNEHNRDRNNSLLVNLQSRVLANLSDLLSDFFNHLDDAFFALAEIAPSNNEQNMYFDAMRELRKSARDVDNDFRKALAQHFDLLTDRRPPEEHDETDNLSLVEKDRVEIEVALTNIRNRIKTSYPDLLMKLSQRLNQYLEIDWLNESNNPLGSDTLVRAFSNAIEHLELPLKVRLILLKNFERQMVPSLEAPLLDANRLLAEAGIEPEEGPKPNSHHQQNDTSRVNPPQEQHNQLAEEVEQALAQDYETVVPFEQLQSLMASLYRDSLNNRLFAAAQDQLGPELKKADLFGVLNRLQNAERDSLLDDEQESHHNHQDMRLLLEHQLAHTARERGVRKLKQVDDDVINLVSMVFESILDDANIPADIALLLGRLQIPMIKIALADTQLFSNTNHPARRLLQLLSEASIGWEQDSVLHNDLLLDEIRNIVGRVLNEFDEDNLFLFVELEKQFCNFLKEEKTRAATVEKRVLETAQGQAKMEQARNIINQLVSDRMQGKTLPSVVIDMIDGPWRVLMLQVLMRNGRDSHEWRHCLHTVDDLIWSIQPDNAAMDRERWVKLIPGLLKEICNGLQSIQHPGLEVDKFLGALWEIHGQILENPPGIDLPNSRKIDRIIDEKQSDPDKATTHQERQKLRELQRKALLDPQNRIQEELRKQLLTMKSGQWVEVQMLDNKLRRCKLAWRDTRSDLYIFVSRRGHKVLETNIDSMIRMVNVGELRLLETVSIWDRAMSNVMGKLRKNIDLLAEPRPAH